MQNKKSNQTRPENGARPLPPPCPKTRFFIITLALMLLASSWSWAGDLRLLRIGTGGKTGVYYPIGKLIAQGLTGTGSVASSAGSGENGVPGYIGVAQNSAGSVENVKKVTSGEIEAGMVQADIAFWAYRADHLFTDNGRVRGIRAIAGLYPEKLQIVVRRDAKIQTMADLRGKRISIDELGSGTLAVMRIVLAAHDLTENDLQPVYLKPVFTQDKIVSGELQGFAVMAGLPMAAVNQLLTVGICLVPVTPKIAAGINDRYPYLIPGQIPSGTYPGVPETPTLQVHALLVVDETMPDTLAYRITAALWSQRTLSLLRAGHPQGAAITPEAALAGVSIPLHPGADKYYRENAERFKAVHEK